jgi:hypothetical protein
VHALREGTDLLQVVGLGVRAGKIFIPTEKTERVVGRVARMGKINFHSC